MKYGLGNCESIGTGYLQKGLGVNAGVNEKRGYIKSLRSHHAWDKHACVSCITNFYFTKKKKGKGGGGLGKGIEQDYRLHTRFR